jgi:LCP family protein required for cell wall assembly
LASRFGGADSGGQGFGRPVAVEPRHGRYGPLLSSGGDDFGPVLRDSSGRSRSPGDFGPAVQGRGSGGRHARPGPAPHTRAPRRPPARLPRTRRRRRLRWLRLTITLLLVIILAILATGIALLVYASAVMPRVPVTGLDSAGLGQMNVLVVGTDSREGLSEEELQALGTEAEDGERTDTIFLLSSRGGAAAVLAFPRDLFVRRCDGSEGRINGAFSTGGPDCLVETVSRISRIPITHYMDVNFLGFIQLVDAAGGVSIFLEEPMVDVFAGVNLPAGCQRLDGRQAIGFVRARKVDDDLGRIARQQRFVKELANEVTAPTTLLNIPRMFNIAGSGARAITADTGLGMFDMLRLARAGRGLAGGGLATYTVPAVPQPIGGADVLVPTEDAEAVYSRFRDGSILDVPAAQEIGLQPQEVTVDVLNGAGVEGLAARGGEYLSQRGFQVGQIGNADPRPTTMVQHAPGFEEAARLVASQLPGEVQTELSPAGGPELALILGSDADLSAPPPTEPAPAPGAAGEPPSDLEAAAPPSDAIGAGNVPDDC